MCLMRFIFPNPEHAVSLLPKSSQTQHVGEENISMRWNSQCVWVTMYNQCVSLNKTPAVLNSNPFGNEVEMSCVELKQAREMCVSVHAVIFTSSERRIQDVYG